MDVSPKFRNFINFNCSPQKQGSLFPEYHTSQGTYRNNVVYQSLLLNSLILETLIPDSVNAEEMYFAKSNAFSPSP